METDVNGDPRYYWMTLENDNIADALTDVTRPEGRWHMLVDADGGVIGYVCPADADRIVNSLNAWED